MSVHFRNKLCEIVQSKPSAPIETLLILQRRQFRTDDYSLLLDEASLLLGFSYLSYPVEGGFVPCIEFKECNLVGEPAGFKYLINPRVPTTYEAAERVLAKEVLYYLCRVRDLEGLLSQSYFD